MISFWEVSKSFGGRTIIDKVSFSITPGEFVCVTGPSGAGKSTFIHMLIRAEAPTGGKIEVDGADLAALSPTILQMYRRRMGVVFQDGKLLPDRTVWENVAFALEVCGEPDDVIKTRVPELLKRVGLTGRENAFPRELSGGEKARAALARALVHRPMIVVADEPTGNLDPKQSLDILALLKQIHAEGTTVILATHDQMLVDALQTRVLRLEKGKIVRDSVGGYVTGVETQQPAARNHNILSRGKGMPQAVSSPPKQTIAPVKEEVTVEPGHADVPKEADVKKTDETPVATETPKKEEVKNNRIKPIAI